MENKCYLCPRQCGINRNKTAGFCGAKTLKITQVSDSFDTGDMTNELFFFPKNNSKNYIRASIKNLLNDAYAENGIIQISTNLDSLDYEYGMYVMSNYTQKKSYALLFEFLF